MLYFNRALNMAVHGNLYFEEKNYSEALVWYQDALLEEQPQSWMAWNAACAAAHTEQVNLAFECLNRAIDLGFTDLDHLVQSQHLDLLKGDQRWAETITRINQAIHPTPQ